ncbi:MAG: PSP1 domain-containing protein, partial [Treponema sp.]|nr:PSP1 domain-containing protein [Treponema sp.]
MSSYDDYENIDEEDIAALEDDRRETKQEHDVITGAEAGIEDISPDTPIYRLRLLYSQETFLAVYRGNNINSGAMVIVPTRYGRDLAQVISPVSGKPSVSEVARIARVASPEDLEKSRTNSKLEEEAFDICRQKIQSHKLEMKLVLVHYLLEEPKILFFFTAENRVDFRELVKDLVSVFKMRIELRQIG